LPRAPFMAFDKGSLGKAIVALALGGLFATLTLFISKLGIISGKPIVGAVQEGLLILITPGMYGAMAVSGNVHAWSLWVASAINGLIYFAVGWFACMLCSRLAGKRKWGAAGTRCKITDLCRSIPVKPPIAAFRRLA